MSRRPRSLLPRVAPAVGLAVLLAAVLGTGPALASHAAAAPAAARADAPGRVIVLAIDGMDYGLTRSLMKQSRTPALSRLAADGTFLPLQTSMPPLSPVAWSNFITGMNPGGHGVYDFLRRDPARAGPDLLPEDAVYAAVAEPGATATGLPFTPFVWPATARVELLRRGRPLWDVLGARGIPATVYKMPANYPARSDVARVLSGMGTPDVAGTYGTFTFLTDREEDWKRTINGGRVVRVAVKDGVVRPAASGGDSADAALSLHGPANPFRKPGVHGPPVVEVPMEVFIDAAEKTAAVAVQGRQMVLREGEWGPWVRVDFPLVPRVKSVGGLVRFFLQSAAPSFRLYASPVNLAPGSDGVASGGFDAQLADAWGRIFTKGMSEETKALTQGLFTTDDYLAQSELVLGEGLKALDHLMAECRSGLLVVYLSTLDLNCHVLWKHRDPDHPAFDAAQAERYGGSITDLYIRLDAVVGKTRRTLLRPGDVLYVVSDHGFVPVYRSFSLTDWLASEGYTVYKPAVRRPPQPTSSQPTTGPAEQGMELAKERRSFEDVDWGRTRAYGMGFQSLYVNLKGREAGGVVDPARHAALVEEIRGKLLALRDDHASPLFRNKRVFRSAYRPEEIYSGDRTAAAPDLVLGYERGYGPCDEAVLGTTRGAVLSHHLNGFSGHHTTDFSIVPGVLFCTRALRPPQRDGAAGAARLEDLTVTILRDFGVSPDPAMTGRPLDAGP